MKYIIRKGQRRARPLSIGLWYNRKVIIRDVCFHYNCRNISDTNTVFGLQFIGGDSVRFGWLWNEHLQKIRLRAYCHIDGVRTVKEIVNVNINEWVNLKLKIRSNSYVFDVTVGSRFYTVSIPFTTKKKFSYPLGFYSSYPAPRELSISVIKH